MGFRLYSVFFNEIIIELSMDMQKMRENLHQQFVLKKDNKIFLRPVSRNESKENLTLKQKVALSITIIF